MDFHLCSDYKLEVSSIPGEVHFSLPAVRVIRALDQVKISISFDHYEFATHKADPSGLPFHLSTLPGEKE